MKSIKTLNVKTKEGLTFKNVQRFPSSEWGDEGGCKADMYMQGTHVAEFTDWGDGGTPLIDWNINDTTLIFEIKKGVQQALKRLDPSLKQYKWLFTKDANDINGDDFGMLEALLECYHNTYKHVKGGKTI